MKVVPSPSALAASIVPPCSSTSSLARARPIPTPPSRRCSVLETWKKRSNTRGRASGGMPGPVSRTTIWTPSARSSTRISIEPPAGVNLRALPTRLVRTISRRCASAKILLAEGSATSVKAIDLASAAGMLFSCTVAASARMSTSARLSLRPPASRRERSRRSSISRSSRYALRRITRRYCNRSGSLVVAASSSTGARMRVSGVRNSCDTLAKNLLLSRSKSLSWSSALWRSTRAASSPRLASASRRATSASSARVK